MGCASSASSSFNVHLYQCTYIVFPSSNRIIYLYFICILLTVRPFSMSYVFFMYTQYRDIILCRNKYTWYTKHVTRSLLTLSSYTVACNVYSKQTSLSLTRIVNRRRLFAPAPFPSHIMRVLTVPMHTALPTALPTAVQYPHL